MVAQKGKDLLLKIFSGGGFVTVAGLRTKRIAFNSQTVDITDADSSGRWRELLAGSGVQRAAISGSGIFKDAASDAANQTLVPLAHCLGVAGRHYPVGRRAAWPECRTDRWRRPD